MWEETLVFNIQMPQIALVRFQVWDHDPIGRDFIGQRTVAFSSMMPGRYQDMHNLCLKNFSSNYKKWKNGNRDKINNLVCSKSNKMCLPAPLKRSTQ